MPSVPVILLAATLAMPGYGAIDAPRATNPLQLATLFCADRIADDMRSIAPFYAPKLVAVLSNAPPPAPWQAYPDRPQTCTPKILNGAANTIGVLVEVTYHSLDRHWSDVLNFERTPDGWLLNNVFYQTGGNLRFRLFSGP